MGKNMIWISPDERIKKIIIKEGEHGLKPTENCECKINITNCDFNVEKYNNYPVVVGQSDDSFERLLDIVLTMMKINELANVSFLLNKNNTVTLTLHLIEFKSNGFIFEWNAKTKFDLSLKHKTRGVELFKENRYIDASHRFSKATKLLSSIPIDVELKPNEIDNVKIEEIETLKSNLYNNLASCQLRNQNYEHVIVLCDRVLSVDPKNLKAMYKLAVALDGVHNIDKAFDVLKELLELDPQNKAAGEKFNSVQIKVKKNNAKVNAMIKKMFV
ncbi:FK506-binding protein-like [Onthophagus taurus]|uniref:FK506-binding protein-like n=1 Tax=Onthophagus taurus TaxID=166361 RepID=UPI000C2065FE|nr:FK506-binding protein-like [Onthophagus taurus]